MSAPWFCCSQQQTTYIRRFFLFSFYMFASLCVRVGVCIRMLLWVQFVPRMSSSLHSFLFYLWCIYSIYSLLSIFDSNNNEKSTNARNAIEKKHRTEFNVAKKSTTSNARRMRYLLIVYMVRKTTSPNYRIHTHKRTFSECLHPQMCTRNTTKPINILKFRNTHNSEPLS